MKTKIKNRTLRAAIAAFTADPEDVTKQEALREACGDRPCFILRDGQIDADATVKACTVMVRTGATGFRGAQSLDGVLAGFAPTYEADPITGAVLVDGETIDQDPPVCWAGVSKARRLVAAYAAETRRLPPHMTSEIAASELREKTLVAPWDRLEREWAVFAAKRPKSVDETTLMARIGARLIFSAEAAAPATAVPSVASTTAPRSARSQREELHNALIAAFPSSATLTRFVRFELGENLETLVGSGNLNDVVFRLVEHFHAHGRLDELIAGACRANRNNPVLAEFARRMM